MKQLVVTALAGLLTLVAHAQTQQSPSTQGSSPSPTTPTSPTSPSLNPSSRPNTTPGLQREQSPNQMNNNRNTSPINPNNADPRANTTPATPAEERVRR